MAKILRQFKGVKKAVAAFSNARLDKHVQTIKENVPNAIKFEAGEQLMPALLTYDVKRKTLVYKDYNPDKPVDANVQFLLFHFPYAGHSVMDDIVVHVPPKGYWGYPHTHSFTGITPSEIKAVAKKLGKQSK